jgi:endonuclease YncB( thermonuclease family)
MLKALCLWFKLCSGLSGNAYAIDGDTIAIMGVHVRLAGLDAEELNEPNGMAAKNQLQHLINQGITCALNGESSYNRMVGTCYDNSNLDISELMVKTGYALDCAHYSGGKYRKLEPSGARQRLIQKPYC